MMADPVRADASVVPMVSETAINRDIGVIDIGSNSVRLVHFRVEGRSLWPIFNEKVMAGLGKGVRESGRLNPSGREVALRALKRFQRLLDAKGVRDRHVIATAAVRNAQDGPDFVEAVADLTGMEVRILSGEDEAALSALGVVTGIPDAHGMMGDLGGSSLELTPIAHGQPGPGVTLPLGPQEVLRDSDWDKRNAKQVVEAALDACALDLETGGSFYAVGGAWRALAQLAFARFGSPLHVVHQFSLGRTQVMELTKLATRLSAASLTGTPGLSSRRVATLPYAALLLRRVMKRGGFSRLVFSAYGVREGVLASGLPEALLSTDPLIAGAEAMALPAAPTPGFGRALAAWIAPAMSEVEPAFDPTRDCVMQETAARLVDIGARLHPDHRADLARDSVLYAPFAGITHAERVFLAAVIHYRYGGKPGALEGLEEFTLLSDQQHDVARMLGGTLRLGAKLSGRSPRLLDRFTLRVTEDAVELDVDESVHDLYVERSVSLLDALAGAIGRTGAVNYISGTE